MGGIDARAKERSARLSGLLRTLAQIVFLSESAQRINEAVNRWREAAAMRQWEERGRPLPPPHPLKQTTVKAYARAFSLSTLVETGTYLGEMIKATRGTFRHIISIELDPHLYDRAQQWLAEPGHVTIVEGDSAVVLPRILREIARPCLFWLDAHHSGVLTARGSIESPVLPELQAILSHPVAGHVVLIDDAHEFVGQGGYPTIPELRALVGERRPGWVCQVEDDIIRLHARRPEPQ